MGIKINCKYYSTIKCKHPQKKKFLGIFSKSCVYNSLGGITFCGFQEYNQRPIPPSFPLPLADHSIFITTPEKTIRCINLVKRMLPGASDLIIEKEARDLIDMSDEELNKMERIQTRLEKLNSSISIPILSVNVKPNENSKERKILWQIKSEEII